MATTVAINTKAIEINNKIPDTIDFITTPEFIRPLSFDARMKKMQKA